MSQNFIHHTPYLSWLLHPSLWILGLMQSTPSKPSMSSWVFRRKKEILWKSQRPNEVHEKRCGKNCSKWTMAKEEYRQHCQFYGPGHLKWKRLLTFCQVHGSKQSQNYFQCCYFDLCMGKKETGHMNCAHGSHGNFTWTGSHVSRRCLGGLHRLSWTTLKCW